MGVFELTRRVRPMTEIGGSDESGAASSGRATARLAETALEASHNVPMSMASTAVRRAVTAAPNADTNANAELARSSQKGAAARLEPLPASEAPSILLVDERTLTRECLAHNLQQRAPYWSLWTAASCADAKALMAGSSSVVLLNVRGASVVDPDVREMIASLAAAAGDAPLLAICGRAGQSEAMSAIQLGMRGTFPRVAQHAASHRGHPPCAGRRDLRRAGPPAKPCVAVAKGI